MRVLVGCFACFCAGVFLGALMATLYERRLQQMRERKKLRSSRELEP